MHTRHQGLRPARVSRPHTATSVAPSGCPHSGVSRSAWAWASGADLEPGDTALRPHRSVPWPWPPPSCGDFIQTGAVTRITQRAARPAPPRPARDSELGGCKERGVLTSWRPSPALVATAPAPRGGAGGGGAWPWKLAPPFGGELLALTSEDACQDSQEVHRGSSQRPASHKTQNRLCGVSVRR